MKNDNRIGLGVGCFVGSLGLIILIAVVIVLKKQPENPQNQENQTKEIGKGIDREKVIGLLTNHSNGAILFNKQGNVVLIPMMGFKPDENEHIGFVFARLENIDKQVVKSMGEDCYVVPLPRGKGSRLNREQAEPLLADWIRAGTIGDWKKSRGIKN